MCKVWPPPAAFSVVPRYPARDKISFGRLRVETDPQIPRLATADVITKTVGEVFDEVSEENGRGRCCGEEAKEAGGTSNRARSFKKKCKQNNKKQKNKRQTNNKQKKEKQKSVCR